MKNSDIKGLKIHVHIKRYHFETIFYHLIWFKKFEKILLSLWPTVTQKPVTGRIESYHIFYTTMWFKAPFTYGVQTYLKNTIFSDSKKIYNFIYLF